MEKMINVDFIKYENSKSDEYIRLDTTIIGIDNLIAKASTAEEANALFKAKDVIYSQQKHFIYRQTDNGWISVKDRLPELFKNVLTIDSDGKIFINWLEDIIEMKGYFAYGGGSVTRWQPLPKPPKGE